MKSNMSLGQFRSEIGAYKHFQLLADDPLSPISISAMFDHAVVVLSASPYVALKNSATAFASAISLQSRKDARRERLSLTYSLVMTSLSGTILLRCGMY